MRSTPSPGGPFPGIMTNAVAVITPRHSNMVAVGPLSTQDILSIILSHRWKLAIPVLAICLVTIAVSVVLAPTYRSEATILIESPKIPQDLIRSIVNTVSNERIEYISQRVLTGPRVLKVIDKYDLYSDDNLSASKAVSKFRSNVEIQQVSANIGRRTTATISFSVAFSSTSAKTAQDVANELITMYLDENLKTRSETAEQTTTFLAEEGEKIRATITQLEQSIAEFKQLNSAKMPDVVDMNLKLMQRYEGQHQKALLDLQEEQAALRALLRQEAQYKNISSGAPGTLLELKKQYNEFLVRNTEQHPDALRMQRRIATMELEHLDAQRARSREFLPFAPEETTIDRLSEPNDTNPDVESEFNTDLLKDPGYASLAAEIETSQRNIRYHRKNSRQLSQQLKELEARILAAPMVEQEYVDLQRDLENLESKYQEIRNKELEAQISQNLEQDQKGERFRLLEGAGLPTAPQSPNRLLLLAAGLAIALGTGVALVIAAEFLNPAIRSQQTFAEALGAPTLLTIPIFNDALEVQTITAKSLYNRAFFVVAASCVLVVGMATIHLFVLPLESLLPTDSRFRF